MNVLLVFGMCTGVHVCACMHMLVCVYACAMDSRDRCPVSWSLYFIVDITLTEPGTLACHKAPATSGLCSPALGFQVHAIWPMFYVDACFKRQVQEGSLLGVGVG